jgi:hypothetical protein
MDYEAVTPELLAEAMADELSRPMQSRPVERDGALRAAQLLAPLV